MGRPPCCDKVGVKKGPWTPEEDIILVSYIQEHGPGNWRSVPTNTGLLRCSKSCRLRWTNYLRPGIKRGNFTPQEEGMIVHLQALLGNKWAAIASYLPQRTDNDIKNYWNTHLKKKLKRFQSALEPSMANHHQDSSTTTSSTQFLSKSTSTTTNTTSTSSFHERRGLDHFTSSNNAPNNHNSSSTYASSTENISRLLEGWMRSSPKPTANTTTTSRVDHPMEAFSDHPKSNTNIGNNNNSSLECYRPKAEQLDQCIDHGGGGELMSHEEFESILSFENLNNVSWDKSSSTNICDSNIADAAATTKGCQLDCASEEKDKKDNNHNNLKVSDQKKHKSSDHNTTPPLSFLEKWLLDESSTAQVEEALELSSIF